MVPEETQESLIFKIRCLCVNASYATQEDEQSSEAIKKENKGTSVYQGGTKEDRSQSIAIEENEEDFPT